VYTELKRVEPHAQHIGTAVIVVDPTYSHPKRPECRLRTGVCQNCLDVARFLVERSGVGGNSCRLVNIYWRFRGTALFKNVGNYSLGSL